MSDAPDENEQQQKNFAKFNQFLKTVAIQIIFIAIKAALITVLFNGWLAQLFGMGTIEFGQAFAAVAIIALLFRNNAQYLVDIRQILNQLHINQYYQNKTIADKLDDLKEKVDSDAKKSYNTEESENK